MSKLKKTIAALALVMTIAGVAWSQCSVCGSGYIWWCRTYVAGWLWTEYYVEGGPTFGDDNTFCNFEGFYCSVCVPAY